MKNHPIYSVISSFDFQGQPPDTNKRDSPTDSVDISNLTNQNEERRTPTPEPTRNNRSPVNSPYIPTSAMLGHFSKLRSFCDNDLAYLDLQNPTTSKLSPAYDESPFPYLQEANKIYMPGLDIPEINKLHSTNDFADYMSDTEVETIKRQCTMSANIRKRIRMHKRRREHNPNELSLAQKLLLYKNVMAYKDSNEQF